jgi:transposase
MKTKNNFKEYNQEQALLCPIVPDDLLEEDHPARLFNKIIESLNLKSLYKSYSKEGNPAYHPKMMLKVLLYSYMKHKQSCRSIHEALQSGRADYIFLSGGNMPDFRTINDFRTRHIEEIAEIFTQVLFLCKKLRMIGFHHLTIDGQKIHANASFRKSYNKDRLEERYAKVKKGLMKLLAQEPSTGKEEAAKTRRLRKLRKEQKILNRMKTHLDRLAGKANAKDTVNSVDEDAEVMILKTGERAPAYNHQSAVDDKYGITMAVKTTSNNDQPGDLLPLVDKSEENGGKIYKRVSADSAFCDYDILEKAETERSEDFYLPDRRFNITKKKETARGKYDKNNFKRKRNGMLVCPEGCVMTFHQKINHDGHTQIIYRGTRCEDCKAKKQCTSSEYRLLNIDSREKYRTIMRKKLKNKKGIEIYRRRQAVVEPLFGNDQKNKGWTQHLLRGHVKASFEFMLIRLTTNIDKIMRYRPMDVLRLSSI